MQHFEGNLNHSGINAPALTDEEVPLKSDDLLSHAFSIESANKQRQKTRQTKSTV